MNNYVALTIGIDELYRVHLTNNIRWGIVVKLKALLHRDGEKGLRNPGINNLMI